MEEQAYGCTENAQYTRALWGFEQLMAKEPECARYYFDYGLTIVRYIDKPPVEMLEDAHRHFEKAALLAPNESRIIKTYGSLLMDVVFGDKQRSIEEAQRLFEGYFERMVSGKDLLDGDLCQLIDTEILFLYAQLLDEQVRDYIAAKDVFEKCIYIASRQELGYEQVDEYRLRYGFHLYKEQEFDGAMAQFNAILTNYRLQIDAFNQDPNEGLEKKDQIHMNNYLRRKTPKTLSHIFANMYLGVIHGDLGQYNKALQYFDKMMFYKNKFYVKDDHPVQIVMLNEYILLLIKVGHFEKAHSLWMESYRLDKLLSVNKHSTMNYLGTNNFDVLTIGGHLFSSKGLRKKAHRYFANLMKMVDGIPEEHLAKYGYQNPYYFYGLHCLRMEHFEEAKTAFLKLCRMHPQFPEFTYQLSISCVKLKQYDEARKYLGQAMNMNFKMIYPKYFAHSDDIFRQIDVDIPEEKKALLA